MLKELTYQNVVQIPNATNLSTRDYLERVYQNLEKGKAMMLTLQDNMITFQGGRALFGYYSFRYITRAEISVTNVGNTFNVIISLRFTDIVLQGLIFALVAFYPITQIFRFSGVFPLIGCFLAVFTVITFFPALMAYQSVTGCLK